MFQNVIFNGETYVVNWLDFYISIIMLIYTFKMLEKTNGNQYNYAKYQVKHWHV